MKERIAFVFPGQGSQFVGMGRELYGQSRVAQLTFEEANDTLRSRIDRLCFEDPDRELVGEQSRTSRIQPALYTVSMATGRFLRGEGITPVITAGHSAGRGAEQADAGVYDFITGLKLMAARGMVMETAMTEARDSGKPYGVGLILGFDLDTIRKKREELGDKVSSVRETAINTTKQILIGGFEEQVRVLLDSFGDPRCARPYKNVPLSHHYLMESIAPKWKEVVTAFKSYFKMPEGLTMLDDLSGQPLIKLSQIEESWNNHITTIVNWLDNLRYLLGMAIIEVGPGKVLGGMIKQENRRALVYSTSTWEDILITKQAFKSAGQSLV